MVGLFVVHSTSSKEDSEESIVSYVLTIQV